MMIMIRFDNGTVVNIEDLPSGGTYVEFFREGEKKFQFTIGKDEVENFMKALAFVTGIDYDR